MDAYPGQTRARRDLDEWPEKNRSKIQCMIGKDSTVEVENNV